MENLQPRRRIDVDEFHRMGEAGELDDYERAELIDGEIFDMPNPGIDHCWFVDRLVEALRDSLEKRVAFRIGGSARLDKWNEFLPDITLLQSPLSRYRYRFPCGEDVLLAIEVSDTTLRKDMKLKMPKYAELGVKEAWVINVRKMEVNVQRLDRRGGLVKSTVVKCTEKLALQALPDVVVDLSILLEK